MASQTDFIKQLTIIWLALIAGLVIFMGMAFLVLIPQSTSEPIDASIYYVIAVVLATAGMFSSTVMYKIQVRSAAQLVNPVPERLMAHYQTALIIKLSLLEGPGLFSIVAAIITQQTLFAALTAGIVVLMIIAKPSELQFREDFLNGRDL